MKNKKVIYLLIFLVVIIWGMVIFRIVRRPDNSVLLQTSNSKDTTGFVIPTGDTFEIINSYEDPFRISVKPKGKPRVENNTARQTLPVVKKDWPKIELQGLIKDQTSSKTVVLLKINERNSTIRMNDESQGVRFIKAAGDSVLLEFNREKKFFRRR
jgi:hypothetical protein